MQFFFFAILKLERFLILKIHHRKSIVRNTRKMNNHNIIRSHVRRTVDEYGCQTFQDQEFVCSCSCYDGTWLIDNNLGLLPVIISVGDSDWYFLVLTAYRTAKIFGSPRPIFFFSFIYCCSGLKLVKSSNNDFHSFVDRQTWS